MRKPEPECPRTFRTKDGKFKSIYCSKWTCERCAPRKLRRLVATTSETAIRNAPLYMLTARAYRLPIVWNRFTQRIRRPYIGAIEHKPDPHIHAIIQKPPRDAEKIWKELGGTYWHLTPCFEYAEALKYVTKSLREDTTESRLTKSRDWTATTLAQAVELVMDKIPAPENKPEDEAGRPDESLTGDSTACPSGIENLINIIKLLPEGTKITFVITKEKL